MHETGQSETAFHRELLSLIARAKAGDESALGSLLEAYRDQLRLQTQQDLRDGLGARVDASDIVQRTCLSAVIHVQDFRGDSPQEFLGWLRQIHRRNMLDEVRRHTATEKRDAAREAAAADDLTPSRLAGRQSTPSRAMVRGEEVVSLNTAIARLPEMQGEVVRMKHLEGCDCAKLRSVSAAANRR